MPNPNKTVCGYFLDLESSSLLHMWGYVLEEEGNASTVAESLFVRPLPLTDMLYKTPLLGKFIKSNS
jgi:hypothetical protein